ncbi:MAG: hypothetical protein JWM99_4871 [Verrucomicrobiales bacterium]|nr:hypothetical protein [Verrucomicrobiales bacterium]
MQKIFFNAFGRKLSVSLLMASCAMVPAASGAQNVMITGVPDYSWYAGCFCTASGNLIGYWDRHGLPNFYTGPTAGGIAPLDSNGANGGIRSLWASKAGVDGRPADKFGHIDDYWLSYNDDYSFSYESTIPDPYITAGRQEHTPDCIGDFMGVSQNKWTNLNGECDGNIDAFAVIFWDASGAKRTNYVPPAVSGPPIRDVPSGLRAWTQYKGRDCEVVSQLADFNPHVPSGTGFSFQDMKAEIDAGYPVVICMQNPDEFFRNLPGMSRANPEIHGMLAYGYYVDDEGNNRVRYKTSWGGSGDYTMSLWNGDWWQANISVRGFITYHPSPQITSATLGSDKTIKIKWDGPAAEVLDMTSGEAASVSWYVVERSDTLNDPKFSALTEASIDHEATVPASPGDTAFFRVRLVKPPL